MIVRASSNTPPAPSLRRVRPVLVTGGAGFIGCNLADRLAREGEHVLVLDALARRGVEHNLDWLTRRHPRHITAAVGDVRDASAADAVSDASAVFHFAAQVAVTTSLAQPTEDLDVNVNGTVRLLEAARRSAKPPPFIFASTNKVYGDLADIALEHTHHAVRPLDHEIRKHGIGEDQVLCFHTPYGCSKGAADQYVLDYARTFGLATTVLRMSCIYGPRQLGTEDQGWVAHFLMSGIRGDPITIYGDGHQVRDVLYVDDAVDAYVKALRHMDRVQGCAFNLGGGPSNAVSLLNVLAHIEELLARRLQVTFTDWRPGDQRYYVSDTRRIVRALDLAAPRPWRDGLRLLASSLKHSVPADTQAAVRPVAEMPS